jgi:hypothetical protein
MSIIAKTPDAAGIATAQTQAAAIASAAQVATIKANQFVFFAAFDGTNNNRDDVLRSGSLQDTNVAQLETQIKEASTGSNNENVRTGYYPGPRHRRRTRPLSSLPNVKAPIIGEPQWAADAYLSARYGAWHQTALCLKESFLVKKPMPASAPLEPHSRQEFFADTDLGFLNSGEKSNDCCAQSRAPTMGTLLTVTTDSCTAT